METQTTDAPRGRGRGFRGGRGRGGESRGEDRPRGNFRGGNRGRGGNREGEREEQEQGGNRGRARNTYNQKRRPPIRLTLPEKEIKLNEDQDARIKELDKRLSELNKDKEGPNREEFESENKQFETTINALTGRIETLKEQINAEQTKRDLFVKSHQADYKLVGTLGAQIKALSEEIKEIEAKRTAITDKRKKIQSQLTEFTQQYKITKEEDVFAKIDQINFEIETQTLSNNELKKKLGEVDRLKTTLTKVKDIEGLKEQLSEARKEESAVFDQLKAKRDERTGIFTQITTQRGNLTPIQEEIQQYKPRFDSLYAQLKEVNQELYEKRKAKRAAADVFYKKLDAHRAKLQEITDLSYERKVIYAEAERIMTAVLEGQKKVGDIVEPKNPHEKEIICANSLIGYLEDVISEQTKEEKAAAIASTKNDKSAAALVAGVHKSKVSKKEKAAQRQAKKTKPTGLVHSMETMSQFASLEIPPPTSSEQIPALLEVLKTKVKGWSNEFVKASLAFNIQENGKVVVSITIA